jgi:bifunctional non-homologous end joining protein LigD
MMTAENFSTQAKCETGSSPTRRARPLQTPRPKDRHLPFSNLPEKKRTQWALTAEEMKNCRWLKPELVAQVEFAEWTPDGHFTPFKIRRLARR